jgi:hypothetical protein
MAPTVPPANPVLQAQAESRAPATSLAYITIGAVMAVLAGTSYFFFNGNAVVGYIRTSFFALGIVLIIIGFTVGRIGRAARKAEVPPPEAMNPSLRG